MEKYEREVFISYAWGEEGNEREEIVNQIDQALKQRGIKIIRDKRNLEYKDSIRTFMERIGKGSCVIVVISNKYLRSKNCMYELVQIAENKEFADRIFPIILSDAKIYDASDRIDYVQYWENEKAKLNKKYNELSDKAKTDYILRELSDIDDFRDAIDELTNTLKNMNTLTPAMHRDSDFSTLYEQIVERMNQDKPVDDKQSAESKAGIGSSVKKEVAKPAFKYGIPAVIAIIGLIILFAFVFNGRNHTADIPRDTPTPPAPTIPPTLVTPPTPTIPPTLVTSEPDITTEPERATDTPTWTVPPPPPPVFSLPICIYSYDAPPVNIRNGPGITYTPLGKLEQNGDNCPFLSARIKNNYQETWFQFASSQKADFEYLADGWISADVLAALDLRWLPLPICIYKPDGGKVEIREDADNPKELQGIPLDADGSNCPFISTYKKNDEGVWYKFAPNQRNKVELQQYAGGWIHENFLVLHALNLPSTTLLPTSTPTNTATATATATDTPTETATP